MRPEKRSTRSQKPIRLDPEDAASGQNGDPPPSPTTTHDLDSTLPRKTERKELSEQRRVRFIEPEGTPAQTKGSRRTRSNLDHLSPDDARSQLPVKKRTLLPPIDPALRRQAAPSRRSIPPRLQQQHESIQSPTAILSSNPPIGLFQAPPRLSNATSNGNGRRRSGVLHRRASLMGVTDLDLSGEKYKGIDRDPDPFDMPGQHWAAKDMPSSFAKKQMRVREGIMNEGTLASNINGDFGLADRELGGFGFGGLDVGLSKVWVNPTEGTCSGSLVDVGESEGWAGLYGVPPHLRQPIDTDIALYPGKLDDSSPEEGIAAELAHATALQQNHLIPSDTIPNTPNDLTPLFQPQDQNKAAPVLDIKRLVSNTLPEPFSCTPSIMHLPAETRDYVLSTCIQDADEGIRIPERNSEARMALEYEMQARRYLICRNGKTWVKDHNSGSARVVRAWMWDC